MNNSKYIDKEKKVIEIFENKNQELELNSNDKNFYYLSKNEDGFFIKTNKNVNMEPSRFRDEEINDMCFQVENFNIKILASQIKSANGIDKTIFSINKFCSNSFNENQNITYKLIIPFDKEIKIRYEEYFSNFDFMTYINNIIFGGIEFNIKEYKFQIYHLNNFFIVESISQISFEIFDKYCRIALASFGFITGFVPMDRGYYFGYEEDKLIQWRYDSSFYKTYKTQYNLLSTNAYDYYQNIDLEFSYDSGIFQRDVRINELYKQIKPLERENFEKLIDKMIGNEKFSEIIFSIISINNLKSFSSFLKAGLYAIVLEMITNIISNKETQIQEDILKLENKICKDELQKQLHNIAKSFYKSKGWKYNDSIVEKRVNGIYTPINVDKLLLAYEILDIPLNEMEKKNIKLRNKLLHGSLPFKDKNYEILSQKIFYINLELNYLVNALVFKYIGYEGVLKNLAKIYLDRTKLENIIDEKYYKELGN